MDARIFKLAGSARENGAVLGRRAAPYLNKKIVAIKGALRKANYPEKDMAARARDFRRLLEKLVPSWVDEAIGLAEGSGARLEDILAINCLPPDLFAKAGMNCSSLMVFGEDRHTLFKIRDERDWPQHFRVQKNGAGPWCQIGVDIGNLGAAHAVNAFGLAGANNTGSEADHVTDAVALNDCHILRYFIETCRTPRDAVKAFEKLLEHKAAGGAGLNRGMIFPLLDRESGLLLECVSDAYSATAYDRGAVAISNHFLSDKAKSWERKAPSPNTVIRQRRLEELVERHREDLSLEKLIAFSRDRKSCPHSLCNDNKKHFWMTISCAIHVLDRRSPDRDFQLYCCGNTRNSLYLPISREETENYGPLADGSFYAAASMLYEKFVCNGFPVSEQRAFESKVIRAAETGGFSWDFAEKALAAIEKKGE